MYLIAVPNHQKKWFRKEYETIKYECISTEFLDYSMLENNIFGYNERFIGYKNDRGLIDDFMMAYTDKPEKFGFVKDCLICVLEDCKDLEYFEMAHNLNLILNSLNIAISRYLQIIEDYYTKDV